MQLDVGSELRRVRESRKLSLRNVASAVDLDKALALADALEDQEIAAEIERRK